MFCDPLLLCCFIQVFFLRFVIIQALCFGFPFLVKCMTNLCHGQRKSSLGPLTESGSDPMASLVPFGELVVHLYLIVFCCFGECRFGFGLGLVCCIRLLLCYYTTRPTHTSAHLSLNLALTLNLILFKPSYHLLWRERATRAISRVRVSVCDSSTSTTAPSPVGWGFWLREEEAKARVCGSG